MEPLKTQVTLAMAETNDWIWNNRTYKEFSKKRSGLLWIQGKPGSGKSFLARFLIRDALRQFRSGDVSENSNFLLGHWFYNRRGGGGNFIRHQYFLRSILYNFSKQSPGIFYSLCLGSYRSLDPGNISWSEDVLQEIILAVCRGPIPVLCIVDAVDEAENANILSVIKGFVDETHCPNAKFIVMSQRTAAIERLVIRCPTVIMEAENRSDIRRMVCDGLETLRASLHAFHLASQPPNSMHSVDSQVRTLEWSRVGSKSIRRTLAHESETLKKIQDTLISDAQGSVLWVKLVLDQLQRQASSLWPCTLDDLKQTSMRIPIEMKEYYAQIATEMTTGKSAEDIQRINRILMWICAAADRGGATLEQLWEAMAIMEDNFSSSSMDEINMKRIPIMTFDELWRKVSVICGPFIAISGPSKEASPETHFSATSVVEVMHKSVRDFLTEGSSAGELSFSISQAQQFMEMHLENYLQIIGKYVRCSRASHGHALSCKELLEYLEERKLLQLALRLIKQDDGFEFSTLEIPVLKKPLETSSEHRLTTVLRRYWRTFADLPNSFRQELDVEDTSKETDINMTRLISANRLFYKACREGLTTAVTNMMAFR